MSSDLLLAALDGRPWLRDAAGDAAAAEAMAALDVDAGQQRAAARERAALGVATGAAVVRFGGGERAPFLHRLLTADVATLPSDRGRRTLLLAQKGHVLADVDLWGGNEAWLGVVDAGVRDATIETLRRFVLRADVTVEAIDYAVLVVAGPEDDALLQAAGATTPASTYTAADTTIGGATVKVVRSDRMPWATQLLTSEPAAVIEGLREADPELCPLGPAAQEALRIEAGVPRAGAEFTGAEFPQEARLESAVSFDKGCYLGQETVARIHYRGHVNRLLTRLALDGDVACPAELEVDGRRVGRVTSSTQLGGHAALGYVRREQAEAGQQLQVVGWPGVTATVLPVPTD